VESQDGSIDKLKETEINCAYEHANDDSEYALSTNSMILLNLILDAKVENVNTNFFCLTVSVFLIQEIYVIALAKR
jgi:hypothetical protein